MEKIPLVYSRLQGDTVKDLIEALSHLDPDAKTRVQEVQTRVAYLFGGLSTRELVVVLPNSDRLTM